MHLVLLQHLVGELLADVGLHLVVAVDDLGLEAADLAPEMVERELDGLPHVLADDPLRAGQRGDEADLELLLGERRSGREQSGDEPREQGTERDTHGTTSLIAGWAPGYLHGT